MLDFVTLLPAYEAALKTKCLLRYDPISAEPEYSHRSSITAWTDDTRCVATPDIRSTGRAGVSDPLATVEEARQNLSAALDPTRRSTLGQFFTPPATARLMASMSTLLRQRARLLDAGAGVGALTAAWTGLRKECSRLGRFLSLVQTFATGSIRAGSLCLC